MKRYYFIASIIFCQLCMGLSLWANPSEQPNVLVILVDDLGYGDLGCQGVTDFETPHIDALAASGIRFTDGYVTAPQCGPSRAGLITGMYQSRFGYMDITSHKGLPSKELAQTLPEQLRAQGYVTGMIGKWHIGYDEHSLTMMPNNNPWDRGFDYVLMHDGGMAHYFPYREDGKRWMSTRDREYRLAEKREKEALPHLLEGLPEDTYLTDYFSEQGVGFIQRNKEMPWFLYLSYNAPHTPMVAKADALKKYVGIEDKTRRALAAMMDSLDQGVGSVLDALEKTGQTQKTIVWFLSDNGGETPHNGSLNGLLAGRKGDVHEGGIRVPFIVSWPGTFPAGKVEDSPVCAIDILPTVLAAAGVEQVAVIHDGRNLLPWLQGRFPSLNAQLFWSWRSKAAIRLGDVKEVRNGNAVTAADGSVVPSHLFSNIRENPRELAGQSLQNPEQKQMLSRTLDAWLQKVSKDQKCLTPTPDG